MDQGGSLNVQVDKYGNFVVPKDKNGIFILQKMRSGLVWPVDENGSLIIPVDKKGNPVIPVDCGGNALGLRDSKGDRIPTVVIGIDRCSDDGVVFEQKERVLPTRLTISRVESVCVLPTGPRIPETLITETVGFETVRTENISRKLFDTKQGESEACQPQITETAGFETVRTENVSRKLFDTKQGESEACQPQESKKLKQAQKKICNKLMNLLRMKFLRCWFKLLQNKNDISSNESSSKTLRHCTLLWFNRVSHCKISHALGLLTANSKCLYLASQTAAKILEDSQVSTAEQSQKTKQAQKKICNRIMNLLRMKFLHCYFKLLQNKKDISSEKTLRNCTLLWFNRVSHCKISHALGLLTANSKSLQKKDITAARDLADSRVTMVQKSEKLQQGQKKICNRLMNLLRMKFLRCWFKLLQNKNDISSDLSSKKTLRNCTLLWWNRVSHCKISHALGLLTENSKSLQKKDKNVARIISKLCNNSQIFKLWRVFTALLGHNTKTAYKIAQKSKQIRQAIEIHLVQSQTTKLTTGFARL